MFSWGFSVRENSDERTSNLNGRRMITNRVLIHGKECGCRGMLLVEVRALATLSSP